MEQIIQLPLEQVGQKELEVQQMQLKGQIVFLALLVV
jgi:hypothetical protein